MKFLKNNWMKIALATITLVGGLFITMLLIDGPIKDLSLGEYADAMYRSNLFMLIAQVLFFVAIFSYLILIMFEKTKKIGTYLLACLSIISLILIILSITNGAEYLDYAREQINNGYQASKLLPSGVVVPIPGFGEMTKEAFINKLDVSNYALTTGIYTKIINIIIFALIPLIFALKKILCFNKRKQ